jgi:short-subunit dehydrogenase
VVTGAASGIGRALALRFAREKMALALCDVNAERLDETAALVGKQDESCVITTHVVDVAHADAVERFADEVIAAHGRVTLLVNNAGVSLHGTFEEISLDELEWLMRINFWGVVYGCKIFLPLLRREPRAQVVNVSSVFGIIAPPTQSAYSASKFAIRGFSESLRNELADSTVGVTCVHPGGIRTRIAVDGRVAEGARRTLDQYASQFDRLAKHSAEFAAEKIVAGVKKNKARVLIGSEAYAIDALQRLAPVGYGRIVRRRMGR